MKNNEFFKIVILGDSNVGKTNFINQYVYNKFINTKNTIGIENHTKNIVIENIPFKIQIIDTAGQEKFKSITNSFYKKINIAILLYDVTNVESFKNLNKWITFLDNNSVFNYNLIIVGNKNDLTNKKKISFEEGKIFSKSKKAFFLETSAKINKNKEINKFIDYMIKEIGIKELKEISKNTLSFNDSSIPTLILPPKKEIQQNKNCCSN